VDYYKLTPYPMDLGTIHTRLKEQEALEGGAGATVGGRRASNSFEDRFSLAGFIADVRTVFHNCTHFNEPHSGIARWVGGCVWRCLSRLFCVCGGQ
jgi:hypothetical protein